MLHYAAAQGGAPVPAQAPQFTLRDLIFVEIGTFHDQVYRPYHANPSQQDLVRFHEATHNQNRIDPTTIAGIAGSILRPSSEAMGIVPVANGWSTRRFRWIAVIDTIVGHHFGGVSSNTEYISGYTDMPGATPSGALAPDMKLFINGSVKVRNTTEHGPAGQQIRSVVSNASHIVVPTGYNMHGMQSLNGFQSPNIDLMTPAAVIGELQKTGIPNLEMDGRLGVTGNKIEKSRRSNCLPTDYLARTLNGIAAADLSTEMDDSPVGLGDEVARWSRARGQVREEYVSDDVFLDYLTRMNPTYSQFRCISIQDMYRMFPNVDHVKRIIFSGGVHQRTPLSDHTQVQNMTNTTNETLVANIIGHCVPGIMLDLMLSQVKLTITNANINGGVTYRVDDFKSLANVDARSYMQACLNRIVSEVMPMITCNGNIEVTVMMSIDVLGESHLFVSYGGGPSTPFDIPSCCDALFSPVVTTSRQLLQGMASTVYDMANSYLNVPVTGYAAAPAFSYPGMQQTMPQVTPQLQIPGMTNGNLTLDI